MDGKQNRKDLFVVQNVNDISGCQMQKSINNLVFILFISFLIGFVSADLLDVSKFNESDGEYGSYDIDSYLPNWLFGGDRADIKLIYNTDQCLINCKAILEGYFYDPRTLLDEIKFIDRKGNQITNIKDLTFRIGREELVEYDVPIYEEVCEAIINNNTSNVSNTSLLCHANLIRTETKSKQAFIWEEYNGEEIIGDYQLEISAKKYLKNKVDWIITIFGEELVSWNWWNSNWEYRKEYTNLTGNITYMMINKTGNDNTDWNDTRFISCYNDSLEFNHTLEAKFGIYGQFRVNNLAENCSKRYYGNSEAESTSSASDVYFNPVSAYYLDANANDFVGSNDGTVTGASLSSGYINGSYEFDGTSDYVNLGTGITPTSAITISSWIYKNTTGSTEFIAGKWLWESPDVNGRSYALYVLNDKLRFTISSDGTDPNTGYAESSTTLSSGQWYHVVGTFDGSNIRVYVDGTLLGTTAKSSGISNENAVGTYLGIQNGGATPSSYFNGKIDEVFIYNKSLTTTQINQLYTQTAPNFTAGAEEEIAGIKTFLLSPINNFNSINPTINFSVNSSSIAFTQMDNITLYIWNATDNALICSNFTSLDSNTSVVTNWTNTFDEGNYIWSAKTCGATPCIMASNRSFVVHFTAPSVNITAPLGVYNRTANIEETLCYNISEEGQNLTEHLDKCWYTYNGTNNTLDCNSTYANFTYAKGQNTITVYANDTFGLIADDTTTWSYLFEKVNVIYNTSIYEGALNVFNAEVILGGSNAISQAIFEYNNTNYTTIISYASGEYEISTSLPAPAVNSDTNLSLGFYLVINGETYLLNSKIQLVLNTNFKECGAGEDLLLNISLLDEKTRGILIGDIELNAQLIGKLTNETVESINTSFQSVSSGAICLTPNSSWGNYYLDTEIRYSAPDYAAEFYNIQRADLENYPSYLTVFDLALNDSTEFLLKYQDDNLISVENAVIQLQRKYIGDNIYEVVEAPTTSALGTSISHIDLNNNVYRATVVKQGVVLDIFDNLAFKCENELSGQCTENLLGRIDSQNSVTLETLKDFTYLVSSINETITTTFIIPSGTPDNINILLTQTDTFGNVSLCNQSITSSAGSIDCSYSNMIGDSAVTLEIHKGGDLEAIESYTIYKDNKIDFLGNNLFIVFILALSLIGMAFSSPEWIVINSIITLVLAGSIWLINGIDLSMGLGSIIWLIVAAGILIFKLSSQEDR